ncbi:MAG: molybdate ABC transporter substrate-binding protein [Desulfurivibrionaceae bacterium]|nr:molybdate ABC transporter substrate-binding protein [Desulfurivibrionaceae bacterium]
MAGRAAPKKMSHFARRAAGLLLSVLLLFLLLAPSATAGEVRLSVAASMTEVSKELISAFGKENPGTAVLPNFASSGALAKQIAQGAPADLYISANQRWMAYLIEKKGIVPQTVQVFAYNSLVFVGRGAKPLNSLKDIVSLSLLAIGSPKSVPAGQYAAQALRAVGVYEQLARDHKLVMAKDVRQALIYAERGEVDGAFVYRTDAMLARQAAVLLTVPAELHDRIAYPLGLTQSGARNRAAQAFFTFLQGPVAAEILAAYGFEPAARPVPEA